MRIGGILFCEKCSFPALTTKLREYIEERTLITYLFIYSQGSM